MSSLKRASGQDDVSPPPVKRKQPSTTTQKAVSNFFKPASQKEPDKVNWRIVNNSLLVGQYHVPIEGVRLDATENKKKIAAFDFDSTLIKTKSGNTFARDGSDWKWWHSSVPSVIQGLHNEGYLIAIISNQSGISLKKDPKSIKSDMKRLAHFKQKASAAFDQLDLPMSLYAATEKDLHRKPRIGMWNELLGDLDLAGSEVDLENSIFVGDAAGRSAATAGTKGDFSCSDRDFAANIGIPFKTPEEFFLKEEPKPFTRDFDPILFLAEQPVLTPFIFTKTSDFDIVIFCGSPGCGKSTFFWKHLNRLGYERVNQDILKSRDRCLKKAAEYLREGKSVLIDNTNANRETRAYWLNLATEYKIPIRCIYFTASDKLCRHNDTVRALNAAVFNEELGKTLNPENRTILPPIAFLDFRKRFEEPKVEEGFQDIVRVDFVFDGTEEQRALWSKYWI